MANLLTTPAARPSSLHLHHHHHHHHLSILEILCVQDGLEAFPIQAQPERVVTMGCPGSSAKLCYFLHLAKGAQVRGHQLSWEICRDIAYCYSYSISSQLFRLKSEELAVDATFSQLAKLCWQEYCPGMPAMRIRSSKESFFKPTILTLMSTTTSEIIWASVISETRQVVEYTTSFILWAIFEKVKMFFTHWQVSYAFIPSQVARFERRQLLFVRFQAVPDPAGAASPPIQTLSLTLALATGIFFPSGRETKVLAVAEGVSVSSFCPLVRSRAP